MADVETNKTNKRTIKDLAMIKRNTVCFFVLDLALAVPFIVRNYSHWGLGGAIAILLLAFYCVVVKSNDATPAAKEIPVLLFFNVCLYLVVSYQTLIDNFRLENLRNIFDNLKYSLENLGNNVENSMVSWLFLLIGGLAVSLFTPKTANALWIRCVGKTAIGASIVMQLWTNGNLFKPEFYEGGETLLAFYLLFSVIWSVFCIVSGHISSSVYKRNNWLSNCLLILFALFCTVENPVAQAFIPQIEAYLLTIPAIGLAWWKVILGSLILVGGAIVAFDYQNETMGADALVLSFTASAIIIIRVLIAKYFMFSWVLFVAFIISSICCLKNELNNKKTLRLSAFRYTFVQFLVALLSISLLKAGLWINLIIVYIYILIFYVTIKNQSNEKFKLSFWLTALSAPAVYAIAYIWKVRFSIDAVLLVSISYVVFAIVMIILNWPHPDKLAVPRIYKMITCAMLVVLCWIAMDRYGADVGVQFDTESNSAIVKIVSIGKNNEIDSVEYQWSSIIGDSIEVVTSMSKNGSSIPIQGEVLTITVTDSHGVVTTKTEWYPNWLLSK